MISAFEGIQMQPRHILLSVLSAAAGAYYLAPTSAQGQKPLEKAVHSAAKNSGIIRDDEKVQEVATASQLKQILIAFQPGSPMDVFQRLVLLVGNSKLDATGKGVVSAKSLCTFWQEINSDPAVIADSEWRRFAFVNEPTLAQILYGADEYPANAEAAKASCGKGLLKEIRVSRGSKAEERILDLVFSSKNLEIKNPRNLRTYTVSGVRDFCSGGDVQKNCGSLRIILDREGSDALARVQQFKKDKDQTSYHWTHLGSAPTTDYKDYEKLQDLRKNNPQEATKKFAALDRDIALKREEFERAMATWRKMPSANKIEIRERNRQYAEVLYLNHQLWLSIADRGKWNGADALSAFDAGAVESVVTMSMAPDHSLAIDQPIVEKGMSRTSTGIEAGGTADLSFQRFSLIKSRNGTGIGIVDIDSKVGVLQRGLGGQD